MFVFFLNIAICFFFSINLFCVFCWSETKSHCFHSLYVCRYIGFYLININNNRINTEYTSLSGYFFSIVLFFKKKYFQDVFARLHKHDNVFFCRHFFHWFLISYTNIFMDCIVFYFEFLIHSFPFLLLLLVTKFVSVYICMCSELKMNLFIYFQSSFPFIMIMMIKKESFFPFLFCSILIYSHKHIKRYIYKVFNLK